MFPPFSLPPRFDAFLEERLSHFNHSLKQPQKLADAIRNLSNLFLRGVGGESYWANKNHRAAYISYFSVLNFLRVRSVFHEARVRGFIQGTRKLADWGCGAGSATWALLSEWEEAAEWELHGVDQSKEALDEYKRWMEYFEVIPQVHQLPLSKLGTVKVDTLLMSYVLNEADEWPEIPAHVKKLVIIEPSTHQAGRRLLQWRDERLKKEWHAWAPCTHQENCPLLAHSGKDWCHHRIYWNKPDWFHELEKHLPMRNDTLTLTYLLLSREEAPGDLKGLARVVGDEQEEKGKTRQMICRGPQREFLSWLHRDQISLKLKRGDILKVGQVEARANELRVIDPQVIEKMDPGV